MLAKQQHQTQSRSFFFGGGGRIKKWIGLNLRYSMVLEIKKPARHFDYMVIYSNERLLSFGFQNM